jgi:UDP-3-O-[3-hydroxymyristoyl] glucosamine N-acyltransferase
VHGVSSPDGAGRDTIVFVRDQKLLEQFEDRESVSFVLDFHPDDAQDLDYIYIRSEEKDRVFIELLTLFEEEKDFGEEVSSLATVSEKARVGDEVVIDDYTVVGENTTIGAHTRIGAHVVVGKNCRIGEGCILFPRVTIYPNTRIGDRVIVHAGVVIGSDGFGYSKIDGVHRKIPQIGGVLIENDVEIGANTTIDRSTLGDTVIGAGTKIDNLVQIAHNVEIGRNCVVCALCGISGSVKIGNNVVLAGQAGIADHVEIEDDVFVLAKAGVMEKVVKRGRVIVGQPANDVKTTMGYIAMWPRLREMYRDIQKIKKNLEFDDV